MCGIAGIVGPGDSETMKRRVGAMLATQARRGPDGEGMESWESAVLGHRRLAIFDLSNAGRQPMVSEDRSVAVVFNGAIYNFRSLRKELEGCSCRFRSQTDTEVILHGYRVWGIDGLIRRLHGMFAIGIWDSEHDRLFLVRDRLGVKPLIYAIKDGQLAFASTVRALASAGYAESLDSLAVAEFVEYGHITDARTIYRGIHKLPAGGLLEWRRGKMEIRSFWQRPTAQCSSSIRFEEAVERTEEIFLEAVKRRLDADVPVGALLSGGIDSALVCWAIAHLGADITAYTVGTPGSDGDESADARATAETLGIRHVVLDLTNDDSHLMEDLVEAYSEPFACGSALGMLRVCRAIKPSATVVLTGDGGDDVFLGYLRHRYFLRAQHLAAHCPELLAGAWRMVRKTIPQRGPFKRATNFINYATAGVAGVVAANPEFTACRDNGVLGEALSSVVISERSIPESLTSARNLLEEMLDFEQDHRFAGEYMTKVDGGAMFYALEARSPFLDQDLWDFASRLPHETRLNRGRLKAILRELARRRIGDRVASGHKRGFSIPVQEWLATRWYEDASSLFADSMLERQGCIRPAALRNQLSIARARGSAPLYLWYLYVLEKWMRHESSLGHLNAGR